MAQSRFDDFLDSPELDMMIEMVSNVELSRIVPTDIKTKNFQLFLFRYPVHPKLRFPSVQLAIEAVERYSTRKPELLLGLSGMLLGPAYERFVFHKLLCKNSNFLPCLVKSENREVNIPGVQDVNLFDKVVPSIVPGVLYRPKSPTNKGFDCILEEYVFQITTNVQHSKMDLSGLSRLIPIGTVKVACITLTRNKGGFKIPVNSYTDEMGLPQIISKKDVYMYYFDFL